MANDRTTPAPAAASPIAGGVGRGVVTIPPPPGVDAARKRRIDLILRKIDSLPTLPTVATRILALTADENSDAKQVVDLIRTDPALTAKVLAMTRTADKGLREEVRTIDRAVVLLGFAAIRGAVLSLKVVELFNGNAPSPNEPDAEGPANAFAFDRVAFWRHSLAVGIAAELIARAHPRLEGIDPDEAFVCGLLHDIGKLALDHVLPRSFAKVIELTDLNQGDIAEFERMIIGVDHHTAGKRLAEQWQLPMLIQDCIWLHGTAPDALPRIEHRRMVGLIGLADLVARQQHLGYSGNFNFRVTAETLCEKLGLDHDKLPPILRTMHESVVARSRAMGLEESPSLELFLQSIQQANQVLGRLNGTLERRGRVQAKQAQVLDAIAAFHARATPGRGVPDTIDLVIHSARAVLGDGFYAVIVPTNNIGEDQPQWLVAQYGSEDRPARSQYIDPPPNAVELRTLESSENAAFNLMGLMPWLSDYLLDAPDLRRVRLLPLPCGWGASAVLLHDRESLPAWQQLSPLISTWGGAIAATAQHDGARRLGEELAEANQALAAAQARLLESESLARLGEMAAGAAHEMNNPLAVISGRSQLLSMTLAAGTKEQKAAQTIFEQSHRLSDLITSLRLFAEPPKPNKKPTDMNLLLDATLKRVQQDGQSTAEKLICLQIKSRLPMLTIDPEQVMQAIAELLMNAVQAAPRSGVYLIATFDAQRKLVVIQVVDDGAGMDSYTLDHAMDPFFSAKKAGRRVGLGLPRARQLITAHGGKIELRSTVGQGTVATVTLPLDSRPS